MTRICTFTLACAITLAFLTQCTEPQKPTTKIIRIDKNLDSLQAGVACAYPDAARIGAEILANGGNAVDAAIAIQWALAVCYPRAGNIGGGGFMVLRMADGEYATLDYREKAPSGATETIFQDSLGNIIPGKSTNTVYAAGVPGTVAGLYEAHRKYGLLPMIQLIEPAIDLAVNGYILTSTEAKMLNSNREVFLERNAFETVFTRELGWNEGDTLHQTELAATLERIRDGGADEFYKGETAKMIIQQMSRSPGAIAADDLASYSAIWRKPITQTFGNYQLISMPPPSSGGIALSQLLTIYADCFDEAMIHNSPEYIHALVEMERRVYADRSEHLGDPDFWRVPQAELSSLPYLRQRMDDFQWYNATSSDSIKPGLFFTSESPETTHLSVVDAQGNAVSVTTTLNDNYGSKIVVKGAGFLLNNEMDDFSSKPGTPNMFGLVGGDANAVGPGKRMLSSMSPSILEKNGQLFLVAGSPGGSTIITSVFQTILNTAIYEYTLEEAISLPKFHSQWLPDLIFIEEGRFPEKTVSALQSWGHTIQSVPSLGRVDAILVNADGSMQASGDVRGDNTAAGY